MITETFKPNVLFLVAYYHTSALMSVLRNRWFIKMSPVKTMSLSATITWNPESQSFIHSFRFIPLKTSQSYCVVVQCKTSQSVSQSVCQSVCQCQSVRLSVSLSVRLSVSLLVSQSVCQSVSLSVSNSFLPSFIYLFFISTSAIGSSKRVRIFRLLDPERGQTTLNFQPAEA